MATFYPSLENIARFKVPPTDGERTLLDFLGSVLDDSYEVYFNPYLNGDRPDVLIMRKNYGVMVIEVKDWNLDNFRLDEKRRWIYTQNGAVVKSPLDQVVKYKKNLYDLHVDKLLELSISDFRHFNIVSCAVYFHCANQNQVDSKLVTPYKNDRKYQDFLKYKMDLIGYDSLRTDIFNKLLAKRYLVARTPSFLFTDELYANFKRLLAPPLHMKTEGVSPNYDPYQKDVIFSDRQEQRVKGVFGSGKTTVMARRAVEAYRRALEWDNNPRILLLTFNITLINFIHDKLNGVEETFPQENFIIINYHQFITAELNNMNIEVIVPDDIPQEKVSDYLEENYYSNVQLFEEHMKDIVPYSAVLIDEIQDYHREWMDIIKNFFRNPQGDYVLFWDAKQNIYNQQIVQKDIVTNVIGAPKRLKICHRSDTKVRNLAQLFQHEFFKDKYEIDDFSENENSSQLQIDFEKEGSIKYIFHQNTNIISTLYNIIRRNIENEKDVSPNDITVLGYTTSLLRLFDCYYRYASRERTNSMMETIEAMYMTHLNYMGDNAVNSEGWFNNISTYLKKKLFPSKNYLEKWDLIKIRQHIAKLYAIYDLYIKYKDVFKNRLVEECNTCGITFDAFLALREHYKEDLEYFCETVYNGDYKNIRDNKKLHFWMNSGTIKISTINSFKGWESDVVFLILEPLYERETNFNQSFDELLYTGITRCRRNLNIINFGNFEYDLKLRPIIDKIK